MLTKLTFALVTILTLNANADGALKPGCLITVAFSSQSFLSVQGTSNSSDDIVKLEALTVPNNARINCTLEKKFSSGVTVKSLNKTKVAIEFPFPSASKILQTPVDFEITDGETTYTDGTFKILATNLFESESTTGGYTSDDVKFVTPTGEIPLNQFKFRVSKECF